MRGLIWCVAVVASAAAAPVAAAKRPQSYVNGGVAIAIPAPAGLVEVGPDGRKRVEALVPPVNRLLAAFVPVEVRSELAAGVPVKMERWALAETSRKSESQEFTAEQFRQVAAAGEKSMGKILAGSQRDAEELLAQRLRELSSDKTVHLSEPIPLGTLFSKEDAFGFGAVAQVSVGEDTSTMVMGGAVMRVRSRTLFVYLYTRYEGEETIRWIRRATEVWASAILAANR